VQLLKRQVDREQATASAAQLPPILNTFSPIFATGGDAGAVAASMLASNVFIPACRCTGSGRDLHANHVAVARAGAGPVNLLLCGDRALTTVTHQQNERIGIAARQAASEPAQTGSSRANHGTMEVQKTSYPSNASVPQPLFNQMLTKS
jgi:hypothetical protein